MARLLRMLRRPVSIRWSIMRNLFLLLLLTCGSIFAVSWLSYSRAVEELSVEVVERFTGQTRSHLDSFFQPLSQTLLAARRWGETGLLEIEDVDALNAIFMPLLRQFTQISSVNIGSSDGSGWLLLEQQDGWMNRVVQVERYGDEATLLHRDRDGRLLRSESKALGYDPRKQPWYTGAQASTANEALFWSQPYTFFTTREPGITIATGWVDPRTGNRMVIAFDIKLIDITGFTTSLDVSPNGKAVILTEDGRLLGLPRDPAFMSREQQKAAVLKRFDELGLPLLEAALRDHTNLPGKEDVFHFRLEQKNWWEGIATYPLGESQPLLISIMVPESDFLGHVRQQALYMVLIFIAALVLAMVMAFVLATSYSKPLEALARRSRRIRNLDLDNDEHIEARHKEIARLVRAHQEMTSGLQSFSRYVPVDLVRQLLLQGEVARIGGETRELSLLFTDIRDFTTISEKMSPEALTTHMARYFDVMLRELQATGATVDKFIGDSIVAFWGAPQDDPEHIDHCIEAVIRCMEALEKLHAHWDAKGLPRLETCFGLGTGEVVVGNVGSRNRLSYTALGDTVNLTSRLEGLNRFYGTRALVMERMVKEAHARYLFRMLDIVKVKGKEEPVTIYELLGRRGQVSEERIDFARRYETAHGHYRKREFQQAISILDALAQEKPDDISVSRLAGNCRHFLLETPPPEWNGVTQFAVK